MGYDVKYRQRVIDYMGEGHTVRETAATFKVSTFHYMEVEIYAE